MIESRLIRRMAAIFVALAMFATACGGGGAESNDDASGAAPDTADTSDDADTEPTAGADETADGSDVASADDVEAVQTGGTIRMALQTEAGSLNPTNTPFNRAPILLGTAIFDTLVVVDADGQWHNNLTESWTPADDFSTWDVTLREGIQFSDGTPLNADAVIRNLEAFLGDPLVSLVFRPAFDAECRTED